MGKCGRVTFISGIVPFLEKTNGKTINECDHECGKLACCHPVRVPG